MIKKIALVLLLAVIALAGSAYYQVMVIPAVPKSLDAPVTVTIPAGTDYEGVMNILALEGVEPNRTVFDPLAERMAYKRADMRTGRFDLAPGLSYVGLIRALRSGKRGTANVVLNVEREPEHVAAKVARFLEPDSLAFVRLMQDEEYITSLGYTKETLHTLFIPNTYNLYWHSTPREFMERMVIEHDKFWDADGRREKAAALGLSPAEVYTLASIVEKESLVASEQPRIAGVYLNRLDRGIPLQADPTAVFATRDFGVKRVLNRHTEFDNPYNTYVYAGLPPGPIAMPSLGSIDGVLNPESHDYIYFCARGDTSGQHNFAETLAGHGRNITIYVANLRRRGLR
ncbi:endolytic transglycosylase MltG [Neolewinella antarctica]|uniref:Endolytic murein transglycosylase n=1 Tax=Neolewinella antarctica TaxID=442734 RepID=A0ABX0XBT2_9BACT|nr:endolytic transglycosylase MltG [Neolewinella antarctica]NJC26731.1 UPF0755 protein [Neolewinella antarctica]